MKKLIGIVLFIATLASVSFAFASCDNGGYQDYSEHGLNFRLPDNFRRFSVQQVDIHYSTPEVDFEVQVLPKSEFEDVEMGYYIDFDMTVQEYTEFFIEENEWDCEYNYDEERNVSTFYVFWTPSEDMEYMYYYVTVLKSESAFYIVLMTCAESNYPSYEEKFRAWSSYLSVQ